ncbi:Endonuclease [Gammaproteobacteria bacterium]
MVSPAVAQSAGQSTATLSPSNGQVFSILSYNIQVGIDTRRSGEYLTQGWKHLLPNPERIPNLNRIARLLASYDLVGLQEVDAGGLRSGFLDQTEYLAYRAGFPYWHVQVNRNLGPFGRPSNGLLSHFCPKTLRDIRLPGRIPGRGALLADFPVSDGGTLVVCSVHLALGAKARQRQLVFLAERLSDYRHVIVLGDFNCGAHTPPLECFRGLLNLHASGCEAKSFPSWHPRRRLDHILVSGSIHILESAVLPHTFSDHLPVTMRCALPPGVRLLPGWVS